jgi:serine/threonine protein kinase
VSLLGSGGMADVLLARDEQLDRDVAVKLFRGAPLSAGDLDRIGAEATILAGLDHPHLVKVFDAGVQPGFAATGDPYLVLEYVAGPTVAALIGTGASPAIEVATLGRQLASALACIHEQGVVHRDVKPANILLGAPKDPDSTWTAKLTDFGIARLIDSAPMTVQGLTLGTPNYLSPEQVRGEQAGPPSDVYSLALVLLELITGCRVYQGSGPEVAFARLIRPPTIPNSLPPPWARLLDAMTSTEPSRRPSAREVTAALTELEGTPLDPSDGPTGPWWLGEPERPETNGAVKQRLRGPGRRGATPPSRPRRGAAAAVLAGLLALGGAAAIAATTGGAISGRGEPGRPVTSSPSPSTPPAAGRSSVTSARAQPTAAALPTVSRPPTARPASARPVVTNAASSGPTRAAGAVPGPEKAKPAKPTKPKSAKPKSHGPGGPEGP